MKYRISYSKLGNGVFISHLDLQKTFQRAFTRGKIDILYSEGFNPHPKMSYTPPLPLFAGSYCEYIEWNSNEPHSLEWNSSDFHSLEWSSSKFHSLECNSNEAHSLENSLNEHNTNENNQNKKETKILSPTEIKDILNLNLPEIIRVNEVKIIDENETSLSELINFATWEIEIISPNDLTILNEEFEKLSELTFSKKNKKNKTVTKDIKPLVKSFFVKKEDNFILTCELSAKNDNYLNPNNLLDALSKVSNILENFEIVKLTKIKSN